MKICVISTTVIKCPPKGYSGLEMIAWLQAKGLAERGHQVLLVAPIGSTAPDGVELHGTTLGESEMQAYSGYWQRLLECQVVLDNSWDKWSYMLKIEGKLKAPILGVLHAPVETMYATPPPVEYPCLVAISKDQAQAASARWGIIARVAYNGVDLDFYKALQDVPRDGRYLFLARMSSIKGPHIAIDVARKCRVGLDLVGDDKITGEPAYSQRLIAQARNGIQYHGGVSREKAVEFFSTRKALLHMNLHYREPFGLAPVEAMACGLGVIAFDHGAMRETVKHEETGFIVKTQEEVEELVKSDAISLIDRKTCRDWASQFSVDAMVRRYEELSKEAVETGGW